MSRDHFVGINIAAGVIVELLFLTVFIGLMVMLSVLNMLSKRNKTIHTDYTITLDESGLTEATPYNTSLQLEGHSKSRPDQTASLSLC